MAGSIPCGTPGTPRSTSPLLPACRSISPQPGSLSSSIYTFWHAFFPLGYGRFFFKLKQSCSTYYAVWLSAMILYCYKKQQKKNLGEFYQEMLKLIQIKSQFPNFLRLSISEIFVFHRYCIKNVNDERVFIILYAISAVYFAGVMVR